ncbi:enediyne antibiotic chromoprotein [Streptomyces sp. NPDC006261]|uniref:enediyne antibiotic chromoprotein n=1 Tax=Streptomyces sp. NPDC006261 TaxID=3156739 RepID=UPI0033BDFC97
MSRFAVLGATATAALAFATGPASAAAALSLSQATGLSDGQSVTVNGTGFAADAEVGLAQCADGLICSTAVVTAADANGAIQHSLPVNKTFTATDWNTGASVAVDCAVDQCRVVAWTEATGQVASNISFS